MIDHVLAFVLPAAFNQLAVDMRSNEATALLLAIGLQESKFQERRQVGGPARGFWQFELGGVKGVLSHEDTAMVIAGILRRLRYGQADPTSILVALEHNDTLAACFARCLLWTLPNRLPKPHEGREAYQQYLAAWRPGKPRPETWTTNYAVAWGAVMQGRPVPPVTRA